MQRFAMELMLHTGAGVTDACRIGPGHVDRQGWLRYKRAKTGTLAICPFSGAAAMGPPVWFEISPHLADCVAAAPKHMTFLSTAQGAARSPKAAQQWFSRAAKEAGLASGLTAHGLRKLRSVMMAEAGAPPEQRMAFLGHETSEQTREYSKTADAKNIISGTDFSNFSERVGKNAD
ncbi:tyrosine-type recombinase/integrase [Antarcticimicrobium luteum]|nr:tyrosine-type recombinase/integrase [Antarcticimicrobium luteum]